MPTAVFVGGPYDRQVRDVGETRYLDVVTVDEYPATHFTVGEQETFVPNQPMTLRTERYTAERVAPFASFDLPGNSWRAHWRRMQHDQWLDPSGRVELRTGAATPDVTFPATSAGTTGTPNLHHYQPAMNTTAASPYMTIQVTSDTTAAMRSLTESFRAMERAARQAAHALQEVRLFTYSTAGANVVTANATYNAAYRAAQQMYGPSYQDSPAAVEQRNRARIRRQVVSRRAERRAKKLLLRVLNDLQAHEYAKSGCFTTVAADGRIFRLRSGKTAELLGPSGEVIASYCIHLVGGYRPEDTLVAQKLMLDTAPAQFEQVANITPVRPRPAISAEQHDRYLAEHERESVALLMGEGIENPQEWDEAIRNGRPIYALDAEVA